MQLLIVQQVFRSYVLWWVVTRVSFASPASHTCHVLHFYGEHGAVLCVVS